jgi:hypothetical protein
MHPLIRLWRRLFPRRALVVLYDVVLGPGEVREEWYGYFDTEHEAEALFHELAADAAVVNPILATVVRDLKPGRRMEY